MGYLKIIIAILIWSSLGIFVRKIGLSIAGIIFYQAVVAGLIQILLLLTTGYLKNLQKINSTINDILLLLFLPIGFIANTFLFYFAFIHTTIANAVLTHYTAPIFVAIMAPIFLKEKILKTTWLAIILSSIGLWFILGTPLFYKNPIFTENEYRGIIAGVLSGLAYAMIILIVRAIASRFPSLFIIFIQNATVSLLLIPFILSTPLTLQSLPYILIMGIVHSTIAPLLYVQGFRSVKANEAAILGYFEPVGAIILALIFLQETPEIKALFGGVLILYSGYMILRKRTT